MRFSLQCRGPLLPCFSLNSASVEEKDGDELTCAGDGGPTREEGGATGGPTEVCLHGHPRHQANTTGTGK
jgi:hypothetical protein